MKNKASKQKNDINNLEFPFPKNLSKSNTISNSSLTIADHSILFVHNNYTMSNKAK